MSFHVEVKFSLYGAKSLVVQLVPPSISNGNIQGSNPSPLLSLLNLSKKISLYGRLISSSKRFIKD